MFKVKIIGPDGVLCRASLPQPKNNLQFLLQNAEAQTILSRIKIAKPHTAPPLEIEIEGRDELSRHLLHAFSKTGTLEDLNSAANMLSHAKKGIKAQLKQAVLDERFENAAQMKEAVREMSFEAGTTSEAYFFPLTGSIWSEEYGQYVEMDESYIAEHSGEIGEYFAICSACDMESRGAYYNGAGADKLLLADWGFDELEGRLYGRVNILLAEPMTEKEENALRNWIQEVNSDGLGRAFERQNISTDSGDLHISFCDDSGDHAVYDAEEMQEILEKQQDMELGGM